MQKRKIVLAAVIKEAAHTVVFLIGGGIQIFITFRFQIKRCETENIFIRFSETEINVRQIL